MKVSKEAHLIYDATNQAWKDAGQPVHLHWGGEISPEFWFDYDGAVRFVRKAYRHVKTRRVLIPSFSYKRGSGNRHNWRRRGVWTLNPEQGAHDLVHSVSHAVWIDKNRQLGRRRPHHCAEHAILERQLSEIYLSEFL